MFVPYTLRKTEQTVLEELEKLNLAVIFSITRYDVKKNTVEYVLVGVGDSKEVPIEARRIVQKNLKKWKDSYTQ